MISTLEAFVFLLASIALAVWFTPWAWALAICYALVLGVLIGGRATRRVDARQGKGE